jgi:hypothetical protein
MKQALTGFLLLVGAFAYSQAENGTEEYHKSVTAQKVAKINLPYCREVVKMALEQYMKTDFETQYSASGTSHFQQVLQKLDVKKTNLNFFISTPNPENKNESVLYLSLNTALTNSRNGLVMHQMNMEDAISLLNNLAESIQPYARGMQLSTLKALMAKSERKQKQCENKDKNLNERLVVLDKRKLTTPKVNDRLNWLTYRNNINKQQLMAYTAEAKNNRESLKALKGNSGNSSGY